jgi:hypothetical protein
VHDDGSVEDQRPESMPPWLGWLWCVVSLGLGVTLLGHVAGVWQVDTRAGPVLLGVVGGVCMVVGVYCAFLAIVNARRDGRAPDAAERAAIGRVSNRVGLVVLVAIAAMLTIVAYYAWLPEQRAAFSGGVTGSVWELRFVWAFAALVFDAIALWALFVAWRQRRDGG